MKSSIQVRLGSGTTTAKTNQKNKNPPAGCFYIHEGMTEQSDMKLMGQKDPFLSYKLHNALLS